MKHFYLVLNAEKANTKEMAEKISAYLKSKGAECSYQQQEHVDKRNSDHSYKYTDARDLPEETECVITLGGDGTLIQAARDLSQKSLPLIGFNMGTLGYLTQSGDWDEMKHLLDELVDDNYRMENRMMLQGTIWHQDKLYYKDIALNEIVVTRKKPMKLIRLKIYVNGEYLCSYMADGIIIATPTGSTAYNLSAGGPIVAPAARMMILTPICPHSLNSRSILLPADDIVKIQIDTNDDEGQAVSFDGDIVTDLYYGDYIEIQQSLTDTKMLNLKNVSFLDNLREKLS